MNDLKIYGVYSRFVAVPFFFYVFNVGVVFFP